MKFAPRYAESRERKAHMAAVCRSTSDRDIAEALVLNLREMLADSPLEEVIDCATTMVADIRAGERLRKGAS